MLDHALNGKPPAIEYSPGVLVVLVEAGDEDTEREGTETVVEEQLEDSTAVKEMVGKDLSSNSTHNQYTGRAEDSPGVVVGVVMVVEEVGEAVETERRENEVRKCRCSISSP